MISSLPRTDTISYIRALWMAAHTFQWPIALWRLPGKTAIDGIVDVSGQPRQLELDLDELPPGFAVSPFVNPEGINTFFLQADIHFTVAPDSQTNYSFEAISLPLHDPVLQRRKENFYQTAEKMLQNAQKGEKIAARSPHPIQDDTRQTFEERVRKAILAMQQGEFQKVVLSRTVTVPMSDEVDPIRTYFRLTQAYPNAFVSLVSIPGYGTWMGASPEIIISVDQQRIFRTVALAGTQLYNPSVPLPEVTWKQKEIEEQALVGRYIINCFKKIRLREYEEDGPQTVIAGNLLHLRTDFQVDMQATQFPQLGTVMLKLLHPTSAVCGMPKEPALNFILQNEAYRREFYSGFLGPVNINQESHLFVNLRCTQWLSDRIVFYAGAGITAGSIPEREWNETELKTQTMRSIILTGD